MTCRLDYPGVGPKHSLCLHYTPHYRLPDPVCRLDYPGIGPEHSYLSEVGRAEYFAVTDQQALDAFVRVSRLEGIIPALETSHAFAYLEVGTAACQAALCRASPPRAVRVHHLYVGVLRY